MSAFQLLNNNLTEIYNLQLDMNKLVKKKKEVLINGKIDELSKIIQQESVWVKQIKDLEENRIAIIDKIIEGNNITFSSNSLTELINSDIFSDFEKAQLSDVHNKLKTLLDEIKRENEINTQLIKQSLDFVTHSLNAVTQEPAQAMTYSKPTVKPKNISNAGIFDKKV